MKFVPNVATLGCPFKPLINKKSIFTWSVDHNQIFKKLESKFINLTENIHFEVKLSTRIKSDASNNGRVWRSVWNVWRSVYFIRRFLNPHKAKYSTNEFELLGVVWAVEHYKNYLCGSEFKIITDR